VGIGDEPWTTLELANIVAAPLVAIDVDPARVARAVAHGIDARVASLTIDEPAILVRAMNVLRGRTDLSDAHAVLSRSLKDGGLLLEGTSDAEGAVVTAWAIRRDARRLLFLTDFSRGFAPALFWDHLPRDLRRDAKPGTAIRSLLDRWTAAFADARSAGRREPADAFRASAGFVARSTDFVGEGCLEVQWPR
jgi:hypothetical protein